jgi:antitoxin component YwqK of YwqJK toxin-antitoxin module
MKYLFALSLVALLFSCNNNEEKTEAKLPEVETLTEYKNGIYTEYYPGKKKIKIRGAQDKNKIRDGRWVLLSKSGKELSVTYFNKGKREGHSIVKYPNGMLHYVGEYKNNQMIGVWKFYDEKGNLKEEKDYGTGNIK